MSNPPFLERLFASDDFLERCWPGRQAVAHGPLARLGPLGELPELAELDLLLAAYRDSVRVALPDKRDEHSSVQVGTAEAASLYREGMALIFSGVERFLPLVHHWLDGLRLELGLPLRCNPRSIVYVSPAGSGNSPHFDANANFVVQVRGTKRWRLAPNRAVVNPTDRWAMNQDEVSEELEGYLDGPLPTRMPADAETFELVPGSVLFVPRGTWHETVSSGDTLALNFTFGQPTWADLMLTALRTRLLKDPGWRALARGERGRPPLQGTAFDAQLTAMFVRLRGEVAKLESAAVLDAIDGQPAWLLDPRAFLRLEGETAIASLGADELKLEADVNLHPVLEWVARQRTPFTLEQVSRCFPEQASELPGLLHALQSQRLLGRHHCRPSPERD